MSLGQEYTGKARYLPDYPAGAHRLFVAVACSVEDLSEPIFALLDTASEWCVLPAVVSVDLGLDLDPDSGQVSLHTRFGEVYGRLERIRLRFRANEGDPIELQATCFVSSDWPGPMVIG
jgi:hypothetical protein